MSEFANFLKDLRLSSNYTQTQFAAKLGIDTAALSKIENGKKYLDPKVLPVISKEFHKDLNSLKANYFGEKMAYELYSNNCPPKTLEILKKKFTFLKESLK